MTGRGVVLVVTHTALLMHLLTSTAWVQAVYFFANAALFALVVNENEKINRHYPACSQQFSGLYRLAD